MKIKSRVKEVVEVAKALEKLKETYYIKPPATIKTKKLVEKEGFFVKELEMLNFAKESRVHCSERRPVNVSKCEGGSPLR